MRRFLASIVGRDLILHRRLIAEEKRLLTVQLIADPGRHLLAILFLFIRQRTDCFSLDEFPLPFSKVGLAIGMSRNGREKPLGVQQVL